MALEYTHDLATAHAITDHVEVMQNGRVAEQGPKSQMYTPPHHSYTKLLLRSVADMAP
jgi:peptide/nickel transport system ATP-binding protein